MFNLGLTDLIDLHNPGGRATIRVIFFLLVRVLLLTDLLLASLNQTQSFWAFNMTYGQVTHIAAYLAGWPRVNFRLVHRLCWLGRRGTVAMFCVTSVTRPVSYKGHLQ